VGRRYDTIIDLYDITTGQSTGTLYGHGTTLVQSPLYRGSGTLQDLAFLDGRFLVSGADDGQGLLWNIETSKGYVVARHNFIVKRVCVSPSGRKLATGGAESYLAEGRPNRVSVVEVRTEGGEVKSLLNSFEIKAKDPVKDLAFTFDEMRILVAGNDDTLWLWSGKNDAKPIKHNFGTILALSQGATKIAAEKGETFTIWDVGKLVK
jgi:WD40 repeat protein